MRKVNRHVARSALLAAAIALGGCAGGSNDGSTDDPKPVGELAPSNVQPGAPGQPTRTLAPEELAAIEPTPYTRRDVRFMQAMIHHHAQALRMTALVPRRSTSRDVALLARRIDISQETEVEQIRSWLKARGQPAPMLHRVHGHAHGVGRMPMPGMATERELKRLEAARGAAFDRLFLRLMIRHHEGAVTMVADLYAAGGGAEPAIDAFARHVDADQQIEIARMRTLLARLAAARE